MTRCEGLTRTSFDFITAYADGALRGDFRYGHLRFRFPPGLVATADLRQLAQECESAYQDINRRFDMAYQKVIEIFLYPLEHEGRVWYALPCLGRAHRDQIHVAYRNRLEHGHIQHEMVHLMVEPLHQFAPPDSIPALLIEGLAEYVVDAPWGIDLDAWVTGSIALGRFVGLDSLLRDSSFRSANPIVAYTEAGSFVRYLVTRYGLEALKGLMAKPSFSATYGKTLGTLEADWLNVISGAVAKGDQQGLIEYRIALGDRVLSPEALARTPWIGLELADATDHLVVERVAPGSPAADVDVRSGDAVLAVNEEPLSAGDAWKIGRALEDRAPGERLSLLVGREDDIWRLQLVVRTNPTWVIH
jgi:hypothetical protein